MGAYDLTLASAAFNATGKFGQSMSGGTGLASNIYASLPDYTIEAWVKTTAYGSTKVAAGGGGAGWVGMYTSSGTVGTARAGYGNNSGVILDGPAINDNNWHHIALCVSATTGGKLWVDGVLAASGAVADASLSTTAFGVRKFGSNSGFDWMGEVDEVAVTVGVKYTAPFTPGAVANNQANLRAVWHLDGDGVNSAGLVAPAATTITMSGPTTGVVGTASSDFTFGANGAITGTVTVTPNDGGAGGTFTPASVQISDAAPTQTAKYTAASAGAKTIGVTNNSGGSLANPASITYTAANAGDTTAPTMNGTLAYSAVTSSGFTLSWVAGSDNVGVVGYEVDDGSGAFVDVGNVLTKVVTGKAAATPYNPRVRDYDAAGLRSNPIATSVTTSAAAAITATLDPTKVLFSPANWEIGANFAKTVNPGAYFKTQFSGMSAVLQFDMAGLATPYPLLTYRVDGRGPWYDVTLAASIALNMPSETALWPAHFVEVVVRSTSENVNRWAGGCTVALIGIAVTGGTGALNKPAARPLVGWYYGDSITEGVNTIANSGDTTVRSDSTLGWAYLSAKMLGAECSIIGFGGQGLTVTGGGSVPIFGSTYNMLRSGVSRSFATPPDYVVINQGTNDAANDITASATAVLNGLLAALPSSTKIIVLRPFNGAHDAQWTAAIAACSAPSRITHVDTSGWFVSTSGDGLHPQGYENIWHIAPAAATAIKNALAGASPTTARTFAVSLDSALGTPAANLTGLKIRCYNPDGSLAYSTDTGTGSASGAISVVAQSTASAGALCLMSVRNADHHWVNYVAVS